MVAAIACGEQRLQERGISYRTGLVPLDDDIEERIAGLPALEPYECVVVGGGIRKEAPVELFETVVDLVRHHALQASTAFDSGPDDLADGAARWLSP